MAKLEIRIHLCTRLLELTNAGMEANHHSILIDHSHVAVHRDWAAISQSLHVPCHFCFDSFGEARQFVPGRHIGRHGHMWFLLQFPGGTGGTWGVGSIDSTALGDVMSLVFSLVRLMCIGY